MPPKKVKKGLNVHKKIVDVPPINIEKSGSRSDLLDFHGGSHGSVTTITLGEQLMTVTGNFEEDFANLCQLHDLATVPCVIPLAPSSTAVGGRKSMTSLSTERKKSHGVPSRLSSKPSQTRKPSSQRITGLLDSGGMGSVSKMDLAIEKTDSVDKEFYVDRPYFFRPCVQVEYYQSDSFLEVKEIYIRGWTVNEVMMNVLKYCCTFVAEKLSLLHFWQTGLTSNTMATLASFLPRCRYLTSLQLDSNPIGGLGNMSELIGEFSPVQHLSMRFCGVTDMDVAGLAVMLGSTKNWNKKLLTLNLSNNKITDVGAQYLAGGLMTNRTLLVLNLASNHISDEGAAALALILSDFPLNPEQLIYRRWIFSMRMQLDVIALRPSEFRSPSLTELVDVKNKRLSSERKKARELKKDREAMDKFLKHPKASKRPSFDSSLCSLKDLDSSTKGPLLFKESKQTTGKSEKRKTQSRRKAMLTKAGMGLEAVPLDWHPLAEAGRLDEDGKLRILGNRSLLSLNLSRNHIREKGLKHLLDMLHVQGIPGQDRRPVTDSQPQLLQPPSYCSFTGLKRLVVHGNAVSPDNNVLVQIQRIMVIRDPFYRMPLLTLHKENVPPCAMPPIGI